MRRNRFKNPFKPDHLIYRFAETNNDGGGEGDGTDQEIDLKAFAKSTSETISALQTTLAKTSKSHGSEITSLKKTLGDLTEAVKALKPQQTEETETEEEETTETEESTKKRGRPATAKAKEGEENPEISELKKTLTTLQKQLETEKKRSDQAEERRIQAETKQRNSEGRRLLMAASTDAKAISPNDATEFLWGKMTYDSDTDTWGIKDGEDVLDLEAGISKFLPKYMIQPKTAKGGSGGHSSGNDNGVNKATLKQNAINLGVAARKNPQLVSRYNKAKKDYEAAEGDVTEIIEAVTASFAS